MSEVASERASLLARYQELKSALLYQLDLAEDSPQYQHSLRQAVRDWHAIARDPTLPASGVHYLLENRPGNLEIDLSRGAIPTIVNVLRRIARDEDIEVFLTGLEFGPGEEVRLVHMADRHGNDIHEYFASDRQDILQGSVASLQGGIRAGAQLPSMQNQLICVAVMPTSRVLDKKESNPGQTEHDRLRLQESMMCYLANRIPDKHDVVAPSSVLAGYALGPSVPDIHKRETFRGPRKTFEKALLNAIAVSHLSSFGTFAKFFYYEPPVRLFESIARELRLHPPRPSGVDCVRVGLDKLLMRVQFANLLPVLRCLAPLKFKFADGDPEETCYVKQWLEKPSLQYHCGSWLLKEDAASFVDICTLFPDVKSPDIISTVMARDIRNDVFCFAVIARLIEASFDRRLSSESLGSCWAVCKLSFLEELSVGAMVDHHRLYSKKKVLARSPGAYPWDVETSPYQPLDPAIPAMVSEIHFRLDQDPQGWRRTASDQFINWLEDCLYSDSARHEDEYTLFWLPLLREMSLRHDRGFWGPATRARRRPWYGDFFRAVLSRYLLIAVGREPPRRDFRRPAFSARERDGCASCRVLSRFLLDGSRVRAIFPVVGPEKPHASSSARARPSSGYVLSQPALAHTLPLLADKKRGCAFHLKDSTGGGTVLCVEKRDGSRLWDDWCGRRDRAAGELAGFDQERLKLILGEEDYGPLVGMEVCRRANGEDWGRMCRIARSLGGDKAEMVSGRRGADARSRDVVGGGEMYTVVQWGGGGDDLVDEDYDFTAHLPGEWW